MAEYSKEQRNQLSRVIANSGSNYEQCKILQRTPLPPSALWSRPNWVPDGNTKKREIWEKGIDIEINYTNLFTGEPQVELAKMCPICNRPVTYQGASIDHIIDWKKYALAKRVTTTEELSKVYNDPSNLWAIHSSCNSSKQTTSLEEMLMDANNPQRPALWDQNPRKVLKAAEVLKAIEFDPSREIELKLAFADYCLRLDDSSLYGIFADFYAKDDFIRF